MNGGDPSLIGEPAQMLAGAVERGLRRRDVLPSLAQQQAALECRNRVFATGPATSGPSPAPTPMYLSQ